LGIKKIIKNFFLIIYAKKHFYHLFINFYLHGEENSKIVFIFAKIKNFFSTLKKKKKKLIKNTQK
jgi:hypothetical protein